MAVTQPSHEQRRADFRALHGVEMEDVEARAAERLAAAQPLWETFCDTSYYDLWAVRRKTETGWGQCFHLHSGEEAAALVELLNANRVP